VLKGRIDAQFFAKSGDFFVDAADLGLELAEFLADGG
jgi:hypothetical protein